MSVCHGPASVTQRFCVWTFDYVLFLIEVKILFLVLVILVVIALFIFVFLDRISFVIRFVNFNCRWTLHLLLRPTLWWSLSYESICKMNSTPQNKTEGEQCHIACQKNKNKNGVPLHGQGGIDVSRSNGQIPQGLNISPLCFTVSLIHCCIRGFILPPIVKRCLCPCLLSWKLGYYLSSVETTPSTHFC